MPTSGYFDEAVIKLNLERLKSLGYTILNPVADNLIVRKLNNKLDFRDLEIDWKDELLNLIPSDVRVMMNSAEIPNINGDGYMEGESLIDFKSHTYRLIARGKSIELQGIYDEAEKFKSFRKDFVELAEQIQYIAWQTKLVKELVQSMRGKDKGFQSKALRLVHLSIAQSLKINQ